MTWGYDEAEGERRSLYSAMCPDAEDVHEMELSEDEAWDRARHLAETERLAVRLIRATEGTLGPLDYETAAEAMAALRLHIADSMWRMI